MGDWVEYFEVKIVVAKPALPTLPASNAGAGAKSDW